MTVITIKMRRAEQFGGQEAENADKAWAKISILAHKRKRKDEPEWHPSSELRYAFLQYRIG